MPWRENVDRHYGRRLEARGHDVTVIDPVEKLLAVGHYLESTVDTAESTRRIAASRIPADHMGC
ncbi:hypothetical protein ACLK2I_00015 [Escherichia coli]